MKKTIANCNCLAEGTIDQVIIRGQDFPTILVVHYEVHGRTFELKESVKLKSEKKKLGFLTIGQKRVPVLGNTSVGSKVRVLYNSDNPDEAYLPDNIGKANV